MIEYIKREALLNAFENADVDVCEDYGDSCAWGYGIKLVKEIVHGVPAADVAPVMHGRWTTKHYVDGILEGTNFDECSVCGYQRVFNDPTLKTKYDYCPRCSAKMDGGAVGG